MLSFSFVTDTSLLYFVVICMLILVSVIRHDKSRLNSSTRISINAAYLLQLHSVAYAAFCILFYVTEKYHLGNIKGIRFALVMPAMDVRMIFAMRVSSSSVPKKCGTARGIHGVRNMAWILLKVMVPRKHLL